MLGLKRFLPARPLPLLEFGNIELAGEVLVEILLAYLILNFSFFRTSLSLFLTLLLSVLIPDFFYANTAADDSVDIRYGMLAAPGVLKRYYICSSALALAQSSEILILSASGEVLPAEVADI